MYCKTCRNNIPDGAQVCPVCGTPCDSGVIKEEINPVPTNMIDYTTNGTPHYVAPKPEKAKKGLIIGIAVAAVMLITAIAVYVLWVTVTPDYIKDPNPPEHECGGNNGETCSDYEVTDEAAPTDTERSKTYADRDIAEKIANGFEEKGAEAGDMEVVYSLNESGATFCIIKGKIMGTVDEDSEYYNPEIEIVAGGSFVAQAVCYDGESDWEILGVYEADDNSTFESDLKKLEEKAAEMEADLREMLLEYIEEVESY